MKNRFRVLLCVIAALALSGCWSRKEPKTLAIVNSIIYDITDSGTYQTVVELMNPSGTGGTPPNGGGSGKSPSITMISEGPSPSEAIRNMAESIERTAFGSHNRMRFFSERLVKKGIAPMADYFLRDPLTNETPLMAVIKGEEPKKIYSAVLGLSDMVGDYMEGLRKTQPAITSRSVFVTTLDFVKDYYHDGKQPVMGLVELVKCESKPSGNVQTSSQGAQSDSGKEYRIRYEGLAAFKGHRLAGYMDGIEARAYNFVTNNLKSAYITILSGEGMTVVRVGKSNADIKTAFDGKQVTLDVKIKAEMNIIQQSGREDITKAGPLKTVEDRFNRQTEQEITAAVRKAQREFQSDIFGFGVAVHMQHPEKWKTIKRDWDDYFAKAAVNVTVESSATRSGEIKEPFAMEDPP